MKKYISSLLQKNKNNMFLKNKHEFKCKCGYTEKFTYFDFLNENFNIGEAITTSSPFISDSYNEESINVTPIYLLKKCPICDTEIKSVFPLSLESLIPLLYSKPPDFQMYG